MNAGQQISTIAIDHVHLKEFGWGSSESSSLLNAIRPDGGLYPYNDSWKPYIRYVKFFVDNSGIQLPANSLGGKVDIVVHIEEVNGTSSSARNNGTYELGYKILSLDRQNIVYSPPDDGVRYRYYNKPADDYVNVNYYRPESSTSQHVYIVTNGTGAASVAATRAVQNNYWSADALPNGDYTVMVFTRDSRGNGDTVYIPVKTTPIDLIPPGQPDLKYVKKDSLNYFSIAWNKPIDIDLKGYRLYYTLNGTAYNLRDNESVLTSSMDKHNYFYNQTSSLFLTLYAVDNAAVPNISKRADVYGIRMKNDQKKILIVDGFDRFGGSGSWNSSSHDFLISHADALDLSFESCANDEIISGSIKLEDYELVIWILGDESTQDETFSPIEQQKVSSYLQNGGKLFLSGSEVAWDLEGASSASSSDTQFLRNILKAKYIADDSNIYLVKGSESTPFEGLTFQYGITSSGSPYNEDYPDIIDTVGGSVPILKYNGISTAAIAYTGSFSNLNKLSQLVYLAFPFETITTADARKAVMSAALKYFGMDAVSVSQAPHHAPSDFYLFQNYPNPFNPATKIRYAVPADVKSEGSFGSEKVNVKIIVFDLLGKEITTLVNEEKAPGVYEVEFNASGLSSGVYFYRLKADDKIQTKKLILLR